MTFSSAVALMALKEASSPSEAAPPAAPIRANSSRRADRRRASRCCAAFWRGSSAGRRGSSCLRSTIARFATSAWSAVKSTPS